MLPLETGTACFLIHSQWGRENHFSGPLSKCPELHASKNRPEPIMWPGIGTKERTALGPHLAASVQWEQCGGMGEDRGSNSNTPANKFWRVRRQGADGQFVQSQCFGTLCPGFWIFERSCYSGLSVLLCCVFSEHTVGIIKFRVFWRLCPQHLKSGHLNWLLINRL